VLVRMWADIQLKRASCVHGNPAGDRSLKGLWSEGRVGNDVSPLLEKGKISAQHSQQRP
jgi:hypothetical protein